MLPRVDFCGLPVSRLAIGGNPISGFSHQGEQRDELFSKALDHSGDAIKLSPNTADILNERAQIYFSIMNSWLRVEIIGIYKSSRISG